MRLYVVCESLFKVQIRVAMTKFCSGHLTLCPNARENLSRGVIASP